MNSSVSHLNKNNQPVEQKMSEQDVLAIARINTPSSKKVQANILQLTQELPQYTNFKQSATVYNVNGFWDSLSNNYKSIAATLLAGATIVAISSSLLKTPEASISDIADSHSVENVSAEQLAAELEWQDWILLQDEFAFAAL